MIILMMAKTIVLNYFRIIFRLEPERMVGVLKRNVSGAHIL